MYKEISLTEFIQTENPYVIFAEYNRMTISEEEQKYLSMAKLPEDFETNIQDLKVLGKREVVGLVKFRNRVNIQLKKQEEKEQPEEAEE